MRSLPQAIDYILLILLALGGAGPVVAQGIVAVDADFGHVDAARRLVLINAPLHRLLPAADSVRGIRLHEQLFTLARPVAQLSPARQYLARAQGEDYHVFFTRLPVLELTSHQPIADTPSVYAHLRLLDSTGVVQHTATGIEWRGNSSLASPKKSYELSLWADTLGTTAQDRSLLGMRSDNKWNLQALYTDQLRARLKTANELWTDLHHLYYQAQEPTAKSGIALAYAEVFLNGSYEGIYALTERIDRKQLQLKPYANGVIKGELYKGVAWDAADTYTGAPPFDNASTRWSGFDYKEPSAHIDWTNLYAFVAFVVNSPAATFYDQYQARFNQANAIDYFLFWNLLRATDNGGNNLYVAKYKAGEPYFFVPWDLDSVLGIDWQGLPVNTTTDLLSNGFYDRLQAETGAGGFWPAAASRWASLRGAGLTPAYVMTKLSANHDLLVNNDVYEREQLRWPVFQYSAAHLTYVGGWVANRMAYLDSVFGYHPLAVTPAAGGAATVQLYPNPAQGHVTVQLPAGAGPAPAVLTLRDALGRVVASRRLTVPPAGLPYDFPLAGLPAGLYLLQVQLGLAFTTRPLLVD